MAAGEKLARRSLFLGTSYAVLLGAATMAGPCRCSSVSEVGNTWTPPHSDLLNAFPSSFESSGQNGTTTSLSEVQCWTDSRSTSIQGGRTDTVPGSQTWTTCTDCRIARRPDSGSGRFHVEIFGAPGAPCFTSSCGAEDSQLLLSSSKWHGFFHYQTEEVWGQHVSRSLILSMDCSRVVEVPVFVIPVLTWQVGHLLIDVLEPLYHAMLDKFGGVDTDVLLFLEVAQREEAEGFGSVLQATTNGDTPFRLLRLFTRHPPGLVSELSALATGPSPIDVGGSGEGLCFADLHLGLDLSRTYYAHGYQHHGSPLDLQSRHGQQLLRRYQGFQSFLATSLGLSTSPVVEGQAEHVTIVLRKGTRRLRNHEDVVAVVRMAVGRQAVVEVVVLDDMPFSEQLKVFQRTTVLISQYGTAAHNVVFLRSHAVLLLLMQPGWCDWRWAYADQARLSHVHVLSLCHGPGEMARRQLLGETRYRWAQRSWRQGPWFTKDADFAVDLSMLRTLLRTLPQVRAMQAADETPVDIVMGQQEGLREGLEDPLGLPWLRAGLVLGGIHAAEEDESTRMAGTQLLTDPRGMFKVSLVPEVVVSREWEARRGVAALEGRFVFCARVLPIPTLGEDGLQDVDLPGVTCLTEDAFNEFSTLDLYVLPGHYVVHAWIADRPIGEKTEPEALPESDVYFPFSTDRNVTALDDPRLFDLHEATQIEVQVDGQVYALPLRLGVEGVLGLDVARGCRQLKLEDESQCARLALAAGEQAIAAREQRLRQMPAVQRLPSPSAPFIFYHLEKSGGSTLRSHLARAAHRLGLGFHIPCYHANATADRSYVSCHQWDVKRFVEEAERPGLAVVAGHFQWDVRSELPSAGIADGPIDGPGPSCFTIQRHPVDRVISFYYERVISQTQRRLNDMAVEDLEFLMQNFYGSAYSKFRDEGMSNAACKLFLDANQHHGLDPFLPRPAPLPLDPALAKQRLSQCVVGVQDDWAGTKKLLQHYFPWLPLDGDDSRENTGNWGAETRDDLRPDLLEVILRYNQCDMELYTHARVLFERLSVVAVGERPIKS